MVSLGCAKNLVDSENMLGMLRDRGYTIVNDPAEAEIIFVNTCGFIEPAKEESIETIFEMARIIQGIPRQAISNHRWRNAIPRQVQTNKIAL